jgi:hypothetical protein
LKFSTHAEVAELVDALASGASGLWPVEVQVLFSAPFTNNSKFSFVSQDIVFKYIFPINIFLPNF